VKIVVVDETDTVVGVEEKSVVEEKGLIYRVSALWIEDGNGNILLAKRALTKTHSPGKWGPAAAGTVEEGETYYSNIIKEAEEELGLKNIEPVEAFKSRRRSAETENKKPYNYFSQFYTLILDAPISHFKFDKKEVAEVKWFSRKELFEQFEKNPSDFLNHMKDYAILFFSDLTKNKK
jgi:isopentenyl-diphosphate delta-isomerase